MDNGEEDAEVIERFNEGARKKPADPPTPPHVWYEYEPHTLSDVDENQGLYHVNKDGKE